MIFGTVGTHDSDFGRFINALDTIASATDERVVIQTGLSTTLPVHADHFEFKPRDEILELQRDARVIVCHAGIGSVIDAMKAGKPLIVVPRLKRFGEHNSDHQLDIARAVERRGWGKAVTDIADLAPLCEQPPAPKSDYSPDKSRLIRCVRETVLGQDS